MTEVAEAWLAQGGCDWVWMRRAGRVAHAAPSACLRVLEGHTWQVNGALALPDGRLVSWSDNLRLWDSATGAALAVLEGHTDWVIGVLALSDGRLLSWSDDRTLRLWDGATGAALATLEGHTASGIGALTLPDGRLVSRSWDNSLRLWDGATGAALAAIAIVGAHRAHPELDRACRAAAASNTGRSNAAAFAARAGPQLWLYAPANTSIPWHADGAWTADYLLPDGTLVARCDKHLAILHLHHGNRRVSIEEAEAILAPRPD